MNCIRSFNENSSKVTFEVDSYRAQNDLYKNRLLWPFGFKSLRANLIIT